MTRQALIRTMWRERIYGVQRKVEVWQGTAFQVTQISDDTFPAPRGVQGNYPFQSRDTHGPNKD